MRIILYTVILVFTLITGLGQAQGQDLEVTVDILEPSEEPGKIGPGIRYLEEKISRSPLKYQNYMELASAFRSIPLGKTATINFNLRQRLQLEITPRDIGDRLIKFSLKIWSDGRLILETDLSLVRLGTVMVGSPGKPDLIIAISEGF
jgi:hypothetical protein